MTMSPSRAANAWGDVADLRTLHDSPPHPLTVADLLQLDVLRRGRPEILSGDQLDRRTVRWVHTSEIYEISPLLKGGEVLLTTGLGLVGVGPVAVADYVRALAERSIAALILELGRTFAQPPQGMIDVARETGLPLITLRGIVPFVEITETVHAMLLSEEVSRLRLARHIDTVITASLVAGAGLGGLLRELAELADCPVRLYGSDGHLVAGAHPDGARPGTDDDQEAPDVDWPWAQIDLRSQAWGRLVACGPSTVSRTLVAERGAAAVAIELGRAGSGAGPTRRRAGALLLRDIFGRQYSSVDDVAGRAAALGLTLGTSPVVGLCLSLDSSRPAPGTATGTPPHRPRADTTRSAVDAVADAAERTLGPCLVAELDGTVLLAAAAQAGDTRALLEQLADAIDRSVPGGRAVAVACGPAATDVAMLARSLRIARESSVLARRLHSDMRTLRYTDLGVHRLISRFATDPELAAFVDEQLGPLLDYDAAHGRELVRTLDTLLACGLAKAETARALHIRRQTLYQRLQTIVRLLGDIDLTARERRTSLDLALVGWRLRTTGARPEAGTSRVDAAPRPVIHTR
jgi:purine catabolism regulator